MLKLNFPEKYKVDLLNILDLYAPNHEVWAYGSRVKGKHHDASDLDLALRNAHDLSLKYKHLDKLREALQNSDIPIIIDVMDWARIPEIFKEEIIKNHVIIKPSK